MNVHTAVVNDKDKWNLFIDTEGGSFFHYFDWKYIYESRGLQYIPLVLENDKLEIIGIFPLVKNKSKFYSSIKSLPDGAFGGFVLKKDLSNSEKNNAISYFFDYIDKNISTDCSNFTLRENFPLDNKDLIKPTEILINKGFEFKYNYQTQLPCTYILELKKPFEINIWDELWDHRLKNKIRKSQKKGVYVIEDKNQKYLNDFFNMFTITNKRLGAPTLSEEEFLKKVTLFKNKTKIFIALLNEEPLAALLCYYQSSTCFLSKLPSYEKARGFDANTLLASEAIRNACNNGYRYCDFGVTDFSAQTRWKEQFKGTKIPLKIYEKRYSSVRYDIEKIFSYYRWFWNNKQSFYRDPNKIMQKVIKKVNKRV
jgi:lipid II:glycine glycyltransferase (peptidoglycan interpeptide bridge formation enzyme)